VLAVTVLAVSFLSYSAVAGVVGGGGIGDLAIRYGYYRFQTDVMVITIVLLIMLVQSIQFLGQWPPAAWTSADPSTDPTHLPGEHP
jgi:D-methionine transport system permease protein